MTLALRRFPSLRIIAIDLALSGADFIEVFKSMRSSAAWWR